MFSLDGKVAVITGAASGIGRATAIRFAQAGAKVVIGYVKDTTDLAREIGGLHTRTDVSKEAEVENMLESAVRTFGRLDIVVNNAAAAGTAEWTWQMSQEALDLNLGVTFTGMVWGIKHAVPRMQNGGSIMSTASHAGKRGVPTYGAYVAAKAAMIGYTKTAALELAHRNIRVNCVCPGTIDTGMNDSGGGSVENQTAHLLMPLGRIGTPEEVAALFHFLAADDCAFITGQAIAIDGGKTAGPSLGVLGTLYEKVTGNVFNPGDPIP